MSTGLMIQGTTSDAGKSTLVTGLCRVLQRRGIKVAPFKPQNMALNSAVTIDGGEIGRAQALQAQACGLKPHSDMNPILLKPNTDTGTQVIVHGKAIGNMEAGPYHDYKRVAMTAVMTSWDRLQNQYDVIVVEGAGSPAEINLRDRDIANMGFAEAADCPVLLIADIDRGGVFAHLVGTLALLSESEQARVRGFIINRFRGDLALLQPGLDWLEQRTGKPVLGVLPYLHGLHLEAEDAINPHNVVGCSDAGTASVANDAVRSAHHILPSYGNHILRVIVPVTPRISNHTDFDPLRLHPQVDLRFVGPGEPIPPADLLILPGSKSVRADLDWLRVKGWEQAIQRHLRYGGKVLGICGGYQMLGQAIHDPLGLEGLAGSSRGLGLLDLETTLELEKQLKRREGRLTLGDAAIHGYEIHSGISHGTALARPLVRFGDEDDGAISEDCQIAGTYLHGLFEAPDACNHLLEWAGLAAPEPIDYHALREAGIDRIADTVEAYVDLERLEALLFGPQDSSRG